MHQFLHELWHHAVILVADRNVQAKFATNALLFPLLIALRGRPFAALLGQPDFWTDVTYLLMLPAYILLVAIPFASNITLFLAAHAPFLNLHLMAGQPSWFVAIVWLLLQDFMIYWQHRALHKFSWLWAVHKIHHSQTVFSPVTAWRTHWLELVYVSTSSILLGQLLGPFSGYHVVAIVLFGFIQISGHSGMNWGLGPLGWIVVSPRFHGRHHSSRREDRDINFGSLFAIWDRLFGTCRDLPLVAPQFGLWPADPDCPCSFHRQLLYPAFALARFILRSARQARTS